MKQLVCLVLATVLCLCGYSQQLTIPISTGITTSLVFGSDVRHVDLGNKFILAQQVKEAPRVVLLKAAGADFPATNLSVVTGDGSVYSFKVVYSPAPEVWVYHMELPGQRNIKKEAQSLLGKSGSIKKVKPLRKGIAGELKGIYTKEGQLFFHTKFYNLAAADLNIESIRFFIRDFKQRKRTAVQEKELAPHIVAGNGFMVPAYSDTEIVFVFDDFSLAKGKRFALHLTDKTGGRHLWLKLQGRLILNARRF